jgi:large conductance mechanosensitive channel
VNDFKKFLLRGNLVELAVAVVIAIAFGAVVTSFVENIVTPLIAAIGGQPDFSALTFEINDSTFRYGLLINALISFVIIAAVVFFLVVRPVNALVERSRREEPADPGVRRCPECLSEVPAEATRCAFCTTPLRPVETAGLPLG